MSLTKGRQGEMTVMVEATPDSTLCKKTFLLWTKSTMNQEMAREPGVKESAITKLL